MKTKKNNIFLKTVCFLACIPGLTVSANSERTDNTRPNLPGDDTQTNTSNTSPWAFIQAYHATYDVLYDDDKLGSATRSLTQNEGQWELKLTSKLKKWLLTLKSNEYSLFQLKNNTLISSKFFSSNKITFKKERITEQQYDWKKKQETGSRDDRQWTLPINSYLFDRMNHILKMRSDLITGKNTFNYPISYKGQHKQYHYTMVKKEKLRTPLGLINTVQMKRTSGSKGVFSIWLSIEHDYFPVKIVKMEKDKPSITLLLKQVDLKTTTPQAKMPAL